MNRVEEILSKHLSDHAINGSVISGATEITLEFTKWKDENGWVLKTNTLSEYNGQYFSEKTGEFKTSEQLFNEWNNLNNK